MTDRETLTGIGSTCDTGHNHADLIGIDCNRHSRGFNLFIKSDYSNVWAAPGLIDTDLSIATYSIVCALLSVHARRGL